MASRIRRRNQLKPPEGWERISSMVEELNQAMHDAETASSTDGSTMEKLWAVNRCNWKRSRPIYEMRWIDHTISDELYEWVLTQGFADRELIQAWRRPGFDRLCCLACASRKTDHGGTCMCRVPKAKQKREGLKCAHCGCPGCCSGDYPELYEEEEDEE